MKRRSFIQAAGISVLTPGSSESSVPPSKRPATFLVSHGAWSAGWAWKKMHPLMASAGHRLITPTYTGLGEREHLANPSIDLETHVQDILGVIKFEQLQSFILVGHSYGGVVATAVADRVPERISQLVYLDAFVPRNGEALVDLIPGAAERMRAAAKSGDGWRVPPNPIPPDTSAEDAQWIQSLRIAHPLKTFETPVHLEKGETRIPRTYIYAQRKTPEDTFAPFAERARRDRWRYHEIDASHSPHITAPTALMRLLQTVADSEPVKSEG
jgi:pimeloyl-ACP methyl ester carboxylesterase